MDIFIYFLQAVNKLYNKPELTTAAAETVEQFIFKLTIETVRFKSGLGTLLFPLFC